MLKQLIGGLNMRNPKNWLLAARCLKGLVAMAGDKPHPTLVNTTSAAFADGQRRATNVEQRAATRHTKDLSGGFGKTTFAEMVWAEEDPGRVTAGSLCLVQVSAQPQEPQQPGWQPHGRVSPLVAGTIAVGRCPDPVRSSGSASSSAMLSTHLQASTEKLPPADRTSVAVSSLTRSAGIGTPGAWKIHSIVLSKLTSLGTSPK